MTVQEAVQLVIQAAAIGRDGEALVLDMGEPVRILDVARRSLPSTAEDPIDAGVHRSQARREAARGSPRRRRGRQAALHPLISHVLVPGVTPVDVLSLPTRGDNKGVVTAMRGLTDRMRLAGHEEVRT